jgi:hypothetical protein
VPLSRPAVVALSSVDRASEWVFPAHGRADGPRGRVYKAVARLQRASGVGDFTPHDLRRTTASQMTSMGISRLVVSKLLNHAERGVTAVYDRYGYDRRRWRQSSCGRGESTRSLRDRGISARIQGAQAGPSSTAGGLSLQAFRIDDVLRPSGRELVPNESVASDERNGRAVEI